MLGSDEDSQNKSRSDEDSINFRPSPNFKHMKKYLKSKFEEATQSMSKSSPSNGGPDTSACAHDARDTENTPAKSAPVQPPLPPNPPPPDTPPLIINLKKEIEDDDYKQNETPSEFNQTEELKTITIKTDQSETAEKPKLTMCRNFARGTCKKGAACIFAHELILSQLPGVYTFCRNFQNSVCSFPKCKFVHATVFEKEYFFRTGYLPPHTLAHLKEGAVAQPPPPPPQPEETPVEVHQPYPNALPPPSIPCIAPVVVAAPFNAVDPAVERTDLNIFRSITSTTSPKREWQCDSTEVSSSPRDLVSGEPQAKKCKDCDSNEFRLQFVKAKIDKMTRSNEELSKRLGKLIKMKSQMTVVLAAVLKQTKSAGKVQNSPPDKEKALLSNHNFSSFLAKMLLSAESGVPPDAS